MAITILENGWISDSFEKGVEPLTYKDAIVMPPDEYNALSAEELEAMKEQRYQNWLAFINTPQVEEPQE